MNPQLCTCHKCVKHTVRSPDGKKIHGSWVHPTTRQRHWSQQSLPRNDLRKLKLVLPSPSPPPEDPDPGNSEFDSTESRTEPECTKYILYFIAWLSLVCGVSERNCRVARDWIVFIIKIFRQLPQDRQKYLNTHKDVRTITHRLGLDPELESCTCCPKCFKLYEPEETPMSCTYQKSKKAQVCGEPLFKANSDGILPSYQPVSSATLPRKDQAPPKPFVPRLTYHTQKFDSWLKWFLNVPGIEDEIHTWRQKVRLTTDNRIVDIQQSKAWGIFKTKTDRNISGNELRLSFSLYIDWFNPFGNKLAGRQASMGLIALTCLDLSPHSRNKNNNMFVAGIIPAPREPDMTTISHILAPLVDELLLLNTGTFVRTPQFPNGRRLSIHLGTLIGDIVAAHKIAGFASHAANLFCSWCKCQKKDIMHMQVGRARTRRETRLQALRWRDADTLAEQKRLLKLYGTRWSELNRLPYWDPVKNVSLGVMHNWYEGVLQHHWRVRWAFEPDPPKHATHDDKLQDWEDADSDTSEATLDFHNTALSHIRKALPDIVLPRGVTQVPQNIGDPKHGKLKASEWHSLFSTYLPLSLIDFFFESPARCATGANQTMMLNFSSLVLCTNIISRKSTSNSDANKFSEAYSVYTETSKMVFESPKILPNHHYALHLPEQMKWWGPLSNVSEFSGERINGLLQKMKTNGIIGEIEGTVLREFCQMQRLNAQASSWSFQLDDKTIEPKSKRMVKVHPELYEAMLQKLQSENQALRHYEHLPHPDGSHIAIPYAREEDSFESPTGLYVSKTKQNRLVAYQKDGQTRYAWITHLYRLPDFENRILVAVKALTDACIGDVLKMSETFLQTMNDLELKIVQEGTGYELLDPCELIAVCAYRRLPAWAFKCHIPLIVLRKMPHDNSPLLYPSSE